MHLCFNASLIWLLLPRGLVTLGLVAGSSQAAAIRAATLSGVLQSRRPSEPASFRAGLVWLSLQAAWGRASLREGAGIHIPSSPVNLPWLSPAASPPECAVAASLSLGQRQWLLPSDQPFGSLPH